MVAADTGFGANWSTEAGLVTAIANSGLPVAALGDGGYALLGKLGSDIGHPHGSTSSGNVVQVADFGASQMFYMDPQAISIPSNAQLTLYTAPRRTVAVPLSGPLPDSVRVASLVSTPGSYPILVSEDQYLLWGFNGLPGDMTAQGKDLLVNALSFLVSDLKLPVKGADALAAAGIDQTFLDDLGSGGVPLHAFVLLTHIPTPAERATLSGKGVELGAYLGGIVV